MFKIREEVGLPHFSKQIYLVYWVQLVNIATLSSSIVSIKLGESVYKPIGIRGCYRVSTNIRKYLV